MIQKKRRITAGKHYLLGLMTAVGIVLALGCQSFVSLADSTGTVTADSANIRKSADAGSEVIGSAAHGATVSIRDEVQDSSGTLWYQVYVDANTTGYIRADLVEKTGGDAGSSGDGGQPTSSASGASVDPDTWLDAQYAVITAEKVNVRTAPATNEAVVDRLARDAQVVIGGETNASDGKKWYYVTFTGTGDAERSGYIRSDLLSLGEMVPVPEEVTPEPQETEPEPETSSAWDYELVREPTAEGTDEYFIWDYTEPSNPKKYPLLRLMEVTKERSDNDAADAKTLVRQRIAIVALVILLVLAIVAVVIMALKLRDVYYEDYEDEEEEEQEEQPVQRRRRSGEAEETDSQRQRRTREDEESGSTQRRRRSENADEDAAARRRRRTEEEDVKAGRTARRRADRSDRETGVREVEYREGEAGSATVQTTQKRKAKNFLMDDDEFEFEFLNMEDKD